MDEDQDQYIEDFAPSNSTSTLLLSNDSWTNESASTDCYPDTSFIIFQYTTDDLLLAASMASTIANILVIFCALKLFKRSGDTMHVFILNMTVGDLILTVFCHPNELLIRKHEFLQQHELCVNGTMMDSPTNHSASSSSLLLSLILEFYYQFPRVVHFFNWVGLAISGLSLTMLNVDKLIYFRWPLSYDRFMSKRKAVYICAAIWAITLTFILYCWFSEIVYIHGADCSLQMGRGKKFFYEIFLVLFCVFPVTSSLIVSIYLFKLTRQKRNASFVAGAADQNKNKVKSLIFIFATTAWTFFSLLPYRMMNLARIHLFEWKDLNCEDRRLLTWIAWVLVYLLTINPIVNPLITSFIYAPYRKTIKRFLVNIPVGGSRPLYTYRGDAESLRGRRGRRGSGGDHELSSLRNCTESVRVSISTEVSRSEIPSTPSTPLKRQSDERRISEEKDRPKSSIYPVSGSAGSLSSNGNL